MSDPLRLYLAATGMITPVGADTAMTAAMVRAGDSAYEASDNFSHLAEPITMTRVPPGVFTSMDVGVDEGGYANHVIKMVILALREALSSQPVEKFVPLLLAVPEAHPDVTYVDTGVLIENLLKQKDLPLRASQTHCLAGGRAAGIQALNWANHYFQQGADYVLVGGSDSYWVYPRLGELDLAKRLRVPGNLDGFAPGEGAGFLLLTRHPQWAMVRGNQIVALYPPGLADEPGHLGSPEPYLGEGLDQAVKRALAGYTGNPIRAIYSSMNGEHHWAKEYGVAYTRNREYFHDPVKVEHPADCYGDLGSATAPVLIALAAEDLFKLPGPATALVYSSSDGPARAALVVEKLPRASVMPG